MRYSVALVLLSCCFGQSPKTHGRAAAPTGNANPNNPCQNGNIDIFQNGKSVCDPNLTWDAALGLTIGLPFLRVGTQSQDPLGIGSPANGVMADPGNLGWRQTVSYGGNWFADEFGSAGGTPTAPSNTTPNQLVYQADGRAFWNGNFYPIAGYSFAMLNGIFGGHTSPTGQAVIWADGGKGFGFSGVTLVADGDLGQIDLYTEHGLVHQSVAPEQTPPSGPAGLGYWRLRVTKSLANPGKCAIWFDSGSTSEVLFDGKGECPQ